ncbi:MAG TPA: VWA-like domain-containing protein [Anaerovoracaceae bacterium]|nr:VWA-like domain-containing protein [Anaerovoracaceae bacterium]
MDDIQSRLRLAEELAYDIFKLSRNTLMIHLRFLDAALIRFAPVSHTRTGELATDGQFLYYNALHVLRSYKAAPEIPVRDYLHVALHCVFRHLFISRRIQAEVWDLACDIAVENVITGLGLRAVVCPREGRQAGLISKLKEEVKPLTAEKLYRYFLDRQLTREEYRHIREPFYADDHGIWYEEPEEKGEGSRDEDQRDENDPDSADSPMIGDNSKGEDFMPPPDDGVEEEGDGSGEFIGEETDSGSGEGTSGGEEERRSDQPSLTRDELEQLWKEIGERVRVDLETASNSWGEAAGDMMQELAAVNREKYDYAGFLRRFSVLGENVEVNDEEFDYIFYTYGLKLYDDMPLVEPLEYKEVKRIREFVVALDTSQSVAGDMVQKFVTKTYNILKQSENFFTKINVHILQCGASVQEDAKITCQEDFDEYIKTMTLRGFGGTDFRPVFSYVDQLVASHEFTNFKGLIYFTDGYGTFPERKPDYDAAFVFVEAGRETPEVPVWAIKLLLAADEIENL